MITPEVDQATRQQHQLGVPAGPAGGAPAQGAGGPGRKICEGENDDPLRAREQDVCKRGVCQSEPVQEVLVQGGGGQLSSGVASAPAPPSPPASAAAPSAGLALLALLALLDLGLLLDLDLDVGDLDHDVFRIVEDVDLARDGQLTNADGLVDGLKAADVDFEVLRDVGGKAVHMEGVDGLKQLPSRRCTAGASPTTTTGTSAPIFSLRFTW